jgi:hypothetical protein
VHFINGGGFSMEKLIITAALTGGEVTREQQPNLPLTPQEIAEAAYECYQSGASIAHVHARDTMGSPSRIMKSIEKLAIQFNFFKDTYHRNNQINNLRIFHYTS